MSNDRYPLGSHMNRAYRFCHKCGHRELINDVEKPLDELRPCPACKTIMSDHKKPQPMTEALETKTHRAQ
jgi:hypothetical protein